MTININLIFIILFVIFSSKAIVQAATCTGSEPCICSSFCTQTGCVGWTASECNGNCNTPTYGWTDVSGSCQVTVTTRQYIDCSQDANGAITVSPSISTSCTNFPTGVDAMTYGPYNAQNSVTITLASGTAIPHYQIDFIFTFIKIDEDESGTMKWESSSKLIVDLYNTTTSTIKQTKSDFTLNGGNINPLGKTYCGDTGKKDQYSQYKGTFTHNDTNSIQFKFRTDNPNLDAKFAVKQFIMVAVKCHVACLSCNGSSNIEQCFSCDIGLGYMLNNHSCLTTCTTDFGYTDDPAVCIYCNLYCKTCYGLFDNCSSCQSSAPWASYLIQNYTLGYFICVVDCGIGYFKNDTLRTCDFCNLQCLTCISSPEKCTSCPLNSGWYNYTCYSPCPTGFFYSNNNTNCSLCNLTCITCLNLTYCFDCTLNGTHKSYFLNFTCYNTCPTGYFADTNFDMGPNICKMCVLPCLTCTGDPSPCQSCDSTAFLFNSTCVTPCPSGYVPNVVTRVCINCAIDCVEVDINLYFADSMSYKLYADVTYNKQMNFTTFDYVNFQTVSITNIDSSKYTVTYQLINNYKYRIIIQPAGYIFIYNETVTIQTRSSTSPSDISNDTTPFKPTNYMKTATINWFLIKSPEMTQLQKSIVTSLNQINNIIAAATTAPVAAQIKKSGIFAFLFAGAQITTCSVFVNSIPAQNMYEGVRFWGIFVLYDVPSWQQNSKIKNKIVSPDVYDLVKDQRRLFNMNTLYWRFHRTGQSSFFMYDVYMPIILITLCWIAVLIGYIMRRSDKFALKTFQPQFYTIFHKIHQVSIMYLTLAMMMQWIYFDGNSGSRWISLLISLLTSGYFICYQLYIYYDMIKYPEAVIGSQKFQYYLIKYGSFLKNIRYQQYDIHQQWSPRHWFRPYNYHFLSYYKKFCMLIAFPIFYEIPYMQVLVVLIIQTIQIIRFLKTQPYYKTWRTVYRFLLQMFLFLFFLIVLILEFQIDKITDTSNPTLSENVKTFYSIGWAGFFFVFAFNIGFLVLFFIDVGRGFKYSTRQLVEQSRRHYYYDKLKKYEAENEQVPLGLMNKWVKLGNLNKRKPEDLPDINLRVQYFKIIRHSQYFDVEILKIVDLYLNVNLNFHQQNNTNPGKKIRKKIKLSKDISKNLYMIISEIFQKYSKKDTEAIVLKTYISIKQNQFKAGDKIPLIPNDMFQKIQLYDRFNNKKVIKLESKIKGFPVNSYDLQSI